MDKNNNIVLGHGSGGKLMHELIQSLFVKYFDPEMLSGSTDSAILASNGGQLVFTTDSYVVDPIFFPGGNIGNLAVCGTVNDLAVMGAQPVYMSAGFILEEGFSMTELGQVVKTMAEEASRAGIKIVTGDTKVVRKGQCDKVFINTSGIGFFVNDKRVGGVIDPGDSVLINGFIADHGMAVMGARESLNLSSEIQSDHACLHELMSDILEVSDVKFARDATRGGLAGVLVELAQQYQLGVEIDETTIPIRDETTGICDMLGFDPLHVANEGKVVLVVPRGNLGKVLDVMKNHTLGRHAAHIGAISREHPGQVIMHTAIGGKRMIQQLSGEQLPRIC